MRSTDARRNASLSGGPGAFVADSNLHPESEPQKRRSMRIVQAVPLTVTGVDALGRPFQERTSSLIINCHGCRYQSKHYVLKNMWVTFEVPHNESGRDPRSVRARVTWIQRPRTVRELFQIGVELEVPGNVWGIAFPPGDWFPFPEASPAVEIPAPSEILKEETPRPGWNSEMTSAPQAQEPVEGNVHVLPLPGGGEASAQMARQVARIVAEAKQQVQSTVRETATRAVAAETRPLLAALQDTAQGRRGKIRGNCRRDAHRTDTTRNAAALASRAGRKHSRHARGMVARTGPPYRGSPAAN